MLIFLDMNGIEIDTTNEELTRLGMDVANNRIDENEVKKFLIEHTI